MAIQRVSVWDALYADVTSEDKFGSGYGRWKGIMTLCYPVSDFVGKFWVTYDSPEGEREFANLTEFATGIGWHITESDMFDTSGPFDTTNAPGGMHPVLHIDAEMEVPDKESSATDVIHHSNTNDRLLAEHFTKQINSKDMELRSAISTVATSLEDAKTELGSRIDTTTTELGSRIDTAKTELSNRVTEVRTELVGRIDSTGNRVTSLQTSLMELTELAPKVCGWSHNGYFTLRDGQWTDFIGSGAGTITGNTTFLERVGNKVKLRGGPKPYDRILRVVVTTDLIFLGSGEFKGRVLMTTRKGDGTITSEVGGYYVIENATGDVTYKGMQYALEFRVPANTSDHPLLGDGLILGFTRHANKDARLNNPQVACYCFGTV